MFPALISTHVAVMAKDLKSMCTPGESVVFEARFSWPEIIERGLGFGLVFVAVLRIVAWAADADDRLLVEVAFAVILTLQIVRHLRLSAILVTDRRLLSRSGSWRPHMTEVLLNNIKEIDHTPGIFGFGEHVTIQEKTGRSTTIGFVPRPIAFVQVLSVLTGRPARTTVSPKFRNLYGVINAVIIAFGLGGLILFTFATIHALDSNAWGIGISYGAILSSVFFLFIPLMMIALILGFLVGSVPAFLIVRFSLTPGEAEQFLRIGQDKLKPGTMQTLTRWTHQFSAWVLSLLYGQKIRCD